MTPKEIISSFPKGNPVYQADVRLALFALVGEENIFLIDFPGGIGGFFVMIDKHPRVLINTSANKYRIHWSMAHELSEYLLNKDRQSSIRQMLWNYDFENERRVNRFASEILMPEFAIKDYLTVLRTIDDNAYKEKFIRQLSGHFNVSEQALSWRIKELDPSLRIEIRKHR